MSRGATGELFAWVAFVVATPGAVVGCNAITGIGDYEFTSSGGAAATGGGSVGGAAGTGGTGGVGGDLCAAGFQCVPEAAVDAYTIFGPDGSSCPSGWSAVERVLDDRGDYGCSTCACTPDPTPGSCDPGRVREFGSSNCSFQLLSSLTPSDGECVADVVATSDSYLVASADASTPEPCTASSPTADPLDSVLRCSLENTALASCGPGRVCVPDSDPTFSAVCVEQAGSEPCGGGFDTAITLYLGVTDTRTCNCSCEPPPPATCQGAGIELFASEDCSGAPIATIAAGTSCYDTSALSAESYRAEAGSWQDGGGCAPQAGHTGSVQFEQPLALCCRE